MEDIAEISSSFDGRELWQSPGDVSHVPGHSYLRCDNDERPGRGAYAVSWRSLGAYAASQWTVWFTPVLQRLSGAEPSVGIAIFQGRRDTLNKPQAWAAKGVWATSACEKAGKLNRAYFLFAQLRLSQKNSSYD
jgi:hypothetical protein